MAAFSDLHVNLQGGNCFPEHSVLTAIKLGYRVIAVNRYLKASNDGSVSVPCHEHLQPTEAFIADLKKVISKDVKVQFLTRITIVLPSDDAAHAFRMIREGCQPYDLLAVKATSLESFELACKTLPVDIISIGADEFVQFSRSVKRTTIKPALARNITFEIVYKPLIGDCGQRRSTLLAAQALMHTCTSVIKNTIISSAANEYRQLRAPHDVANIAVLFGMRTHTSKEVVSSNCRKAIKHAEARRACKTAMIVEDPENQRVKPIKRHGEELPKDIKKKKVESKVTAN